MGVRTYKLIKLAEDQLRSSICLFFKGDLVSSITLAGAADVLLCRIVENMGKKISQPTC